GAQFVHFSWGIIASSRLGAAKRNAGHSNLCCLLKRDPGSSSSTLASSSWVALANANGREGKTRPGRALSGPLNRGRELRFRSPKKDRALLTGARRLPNL